MFGKFLYAGAIAVLAFSVNAWAAHYPSPVSATPTDDPITYVDAIHGSQDLTVLWSPSDTNTKLAVPVAGSDVWDYPADSSNVGTGLTGPATVQYGGGIDWDWRNFGNYGTNNVDGVNGQAKSIYQSQASGEGLPAGYGGRAPRLVTTISGLSWGYSYHVYVYFWTDTSSWRIRAGFNGAMTRLPLYGANDGNGQYGSSPLSRGGPTTPLVHNLSTDGSPVAVTYPGLIVSEATGIAAEDGHDVVSGAQYWANQAVEETIAGVLYTPVWPDVNDGNRRLMEGYLGVRKADASGEIKVYIDDEDLEALWKSRGTNGFTGSRDGVTVGNASNYRTWYDGVGHTQADIPEPATMALMGLGSVLMIARRRA